MVRLDEAIQRLEQNGRSIAALFTGVDVTQARWKPSLDDWSLLEVMSHLFDEEREDFRQRLDILLHRPDAPWPSIDPPGWVTACRYNEREPDSALASFLRERENSLDWLRSLKSPDWTSTGNTPWGSSMSAGEMLHCWLAHDMLHLRQMVELQYQYLAHASAPASLAYAGDW